MQNPRARAISPELRRRTLENSNHTQYTDTLSLETVVRIISGSSGPFRLLHGTAERVRFPSLGHESIDPQGLPKIYSRPHPSAERTLAMMHHRVSDCDPALPL